MGLIWTYLLSSRHLREAINAGLLKLSVIKTRFFNIPFLRNDEQK
ncbi:hypothetical protein VRK_41330 [Vibrio sp. MEBiC08052]|nr:hypothetical protein VRK_41330 [Vibrio sp. MEBiC08052]